MGRDAKRAQKAAEKRRQRQQQMRQEKTRRKTEEQGTRESGRRTEDLPIVECVISRGWRERGLAHILLARGLGDGHLLVGGYYVDPLCVGLKDCAAIPRVEREEYFENVRPNIFNDEVEFEPMEPGIARALVEGSIAFAGELGFKPTRRWSEARRVFRGITPMADGLEFGRDGKPCLVLRDREDLKGAQARLQRKLASGEYEIQDERSELRGKEV